MNKTSYLAFYLGLFIALFSCFDASAVQDKNTVKATCLTGNAPADKTLQIIIQEILPIKELRAELIDLLLTTKDNICRKILENYLTKTLAEGEKSAGDQGRLGLILLGITVKNPIVSQIIANEIEHNRGTEMLDALETSNPELYFHTLKGWILQTEKQIRDTGKLGKQDVVHYGKTVLPSTNIPNNVKPVSPLIIERYFNYLKMHPEITATSEELSALNAIFSASVVGYRQIFQPSVEKIFEKNMKNWIPTFRTEPVWIQFRLVPLMGNIQSPEIVKELFWLAQNHIDVRMRSIANNALDNLTKK